MAPEARRESVPPQSVESRIHVAEGLFLPEDLGGTRLEGLGVSRQQRHPRSACAERAGDGTANPARSPCHNHTAACEFLPFRRSPHQPRYPPRRRESGGRVKRGLRGMRWCSLGSRTAGWADGACGTPRARRSRAGSLTAGTVRAAFTGGSVRRDHEGSCGTRGSAGSDWQSAVGRSAAIVRGRRAAGTRGTLRSAGSDAR